MRKLIHKRTKKIGAPPGTLVHVGEKKKETVNISVIRYNQTQYEEKTIASLDELLPPTNDYITWLHIDGLHDVNIIEKIGGRYNLHSLLLEDILNTDQRPKIEDYGEYLFVVTKMLYFDDRNVEVKSEQVSLVIGSNMLISFHEDERGFFNPVRERIKHGKGRIRKMGSDYLAYALIDTLVDNYFLVLEKFGEKIESLEQSLIIHPTASSLVTINAIKRELLFIRKSVWPMRELVTILERRDSHLIQKDTVIYLRDLYDHTIQIIDLIETLRDVLTGMLDIYLSSISNKTNEVIKVLTIIATIFIPLTFIVGIYGMNFEFMPELQLRWAYPVIMFLMASLAMSMLFYFRKKKWI